MPCLFGSENELGLVAESRGGIRPAPAEMASAIVAHVADSHTHLPSPPPERRIFLANGACVYADIGGHPEIATAECTNPKDLAAQTIALRQMLAESANLVGRAYDIPIRLLANNVDYALPVANTYGNHLNFHCPSCSFDRVVTQLTPLLVAMPIIAGAGGVSFASGSGGFTLSQRAGVMASVSGKFTTNDSRSMITNKDESLAERGRRIHLISMDTVMSPWQLTLVPAILALTLKALETGVDIVGPLTLATPMESLRKISLDPSLSVRLGLKDGGATTALRIHDHYRSSVACALGHADKPDWADEMFDLWGDIIGNLRTDVFSEVSRLDWVAKLVLLTQELERVRLSWKELSRWIYTLASVRRLKATFPDLDLRLPQVPVKIRASALGILEGHFVKNGLSWKDFPKLWKAANRLCQQCLRYHFLSSDNCPITPSTSQKFVPAQRIDELRDVPPQGTRAFLRGQAIRSAPAGGTAWWTYVDYGTRRLLLDDPFGIGAAWRDPRSGKARKESRA